MRIAALLLPLLLLAAGPAAARGPSVGEVPPGFVGKDAAGKPVDLAAWRGKLVVVAFWTSSCEYCLKEVPTLNSLQKQLGQFGLQVVAVNLNDSSKDYGDMQRQMRDYALVLAHDDGRAVAEAWGVQMFPNLWIVGRDGRVVAHHEGYFDDALPGILGEIQRAVAAAAPVPPQER